MRDNGNVIIYNR